MSQCINLEDCNLLMRNVLAKPNFKISGYTIKSFSDDLLGFMGEHFILSVEAEDKTYTFFVKNLRSTPMEECFRDARYFEKELLVYQFCQEAKTVLPELDFSVVPELFYHKSNGTLVLENLEEKGGKVCVLTNFDDPHMYVALQALAKFHAISLGFDERKCKITEKLGEMPNPLFVRDPESSGNKFVMSSLLGCETLIDLLWQGDEDLKIKFRKSFEENFKLLNGGDEFRQVLSHGDLWINNLVFQYEKDNPVHCFLVDYQLGCYAPPAYDLTTLIYCAASKESQKYHIHDYYDYYYASLKLQLAKLNLDIKKILPLSEFRTTCNLYMTCSTLIWLMFRQVTQAKDSLTEVSNDMKLYKEVMLGDKRPWFIKNNFQTNLNYRSFITQRMEDYKNIITHNYITIEDCYKLVASNISTKYNLLDYKLEPLAERGGFLGEHAVLTIRVETKNKQKVLDYFVKLEPETPSQRDFAAENGACFKETQFFSEIINDFLKQNINIQDVGPTCYFACSKYLIFENLKSQNYVLYDKRVSLPLDIFKIGLDKMAKLHAAAIVFEEKTNTKLNEVYPTEFKETFYIACAKSIGLLEAGKSGIAEEIRLISNHTSNITPEQFTNIACEYISNYRNFVKPSKKFRNTICHGDLWANNIMFNKELRDAKIVDYQSYRYCPPAHDVMQYLYLSTDQSFRIKHTDQILEYYYLQFKKNIESYSINCENILTYRDFLESCEIEKTFAILQTKTHFHTILLTSKDMDELFADTKYLNKAMFVDRTEFIRKNFEKDAVYKMRNQEAVQDLRELCENYEMKIRSDLI